MWNAWTANESKEDTHGRKKKQQNQQRQQRQRLRRRRWRWRTEDVNNKSENKCINNASSQIDANHQPNTIKITKSTKKHNRHTQRITLLFARLILFVRSPSFSLRSYLSFFKLISGCVCFFGCCLPLNGIVVINSICEAGSGADRMRHTAQKWIEQKKKKNAPISSTNQPKRVLNNTFISNIIYERWWKNNTQNNLSINRECHSERFMFSISMSSLLSACVRARQFSYCFRLICVAFDSVEAFNCIWFFVGVSFWQKLMWCTIFG